MTPAESAPSPPLRRAAGDAAIQAAAPTTTAAAPTAAAALDRHATAGLAMTPSTSSLRGGAADPAIQTSASIAATGSLSPVAPWRVVNIGNSDKVRLLDFIDAIEDCLGKQAVRNYMPMQPGDVPATWADASLLQQLTGYKPQTDFKHGVRQFVQWYREFYGQ